jgi:hypothetical protein
MAAGARACDPGSDFPWLMGRGGCPGGNGLGVLDILNYALERVQISKRLDDWEEVIDNAPLK